MMSSKIDIDFSLALENRTGKYFICRDLIEDLSDVTNTIRYWRQSREYTPRSFGARTIWRLLLAEVKLRSKFPLFHALCPRVSSPRPTLFTDPLQTAYHEVKKEDIVLCHDMGPVTHPDLYNAHVQSMYKLAFQCIAAARPNIVFVSRSSKTEFERLFGAAYSSARVLYPGMRLEVATGGLTPIEGVLPPFLLTVGTVGTRKNQARAIEAFKRSGLREKGFSYVVCGGPDYGYQQVLDLAAKTPGVVLTGYSSETELRWLYQNAAGFVLPSLLEGFGIPAFEAVVRGLVPLVGLDGALHEVVGDAAILVDPLSIESISNGMQHLASLEDTDRKNRLLRLTEHTAKFGQKCARQIWRDAFIDISSAA